jgi:cytochrome c553
MTRGAIMRPVVIAVAMLSLLSMAGSVHAADIAAGKAKAETCAACHG